MRGKESAAAALSGILGITPAYAGKRFSRSRFVLDCEDHPRLCGEKCTVLPYTGSHIGSPPPMRGKGRDRVFQNAVTRITPAYTGKSCLMQNRYLP